MPEVIGLIDFDGCGDGDRGLMDLLGGKWTRASNGITQRVEAAGSPWGGDTYGIGVGISPFNGKGWARRSFTGLTHGIIAFHYKVAAQSPFNELPEIRFQYGDFTQFTISIDLTNRPILHDANLTLQGGGLTDTFDYGTFYWVVVEYFVHDTLGFVRIFLSNDLTHEWINIDTKQSSVPAMVDRVMWLNGENQNIYFDDFLVINADVIGVVIPQVSFIGKRQLNSDQTPLEWTPTPGGSHFGTVDELPFSPADFISTSVSGNVDMFGIASDGITFDAAAVRTITQAKALTTPAVIKPRIRNGSDIIHGAPWNLTLSSDVYYDIFARQPNGTLWTNPAVDALHVGPALV